MKPITPTQFLEQVELGAEVQPGTRFEIGLQVGRFQYTCDLEEFTFQERTRLEQLYKTGSILFGYPGDFTAGLAPTLPFFFRCPPRTRLTRL